MNKEINFKKTKKIKTSFYLKEKILEKVRNDATKCGVPVNKVVTDIIENYYKDDKDRE